MQQLEQLKQILKQEVAWYTESSTDEGSICAYFMSSSKNPRIDNKDWISWVLEHKTATIPFIKDVFAQALPNKEVTISYGNGMGGHVHYISITAKNVARKEVLPHYNSEEDVLNRNAERFVTIVIRKLRQDFHLGHRIIVLEEKMKDAFEQDEAIGGAHYITWWLTITKFSMDIERLLIDRIRKNFPNEESFELDTSQELRTYTIAFFKDNENTEEF
jgi:hypothetical protein